MNGRQIAALQMFALFHFNPWNLAGDHNKVHRQSMMSLLRGRKCTKAESGVTALRAEFDALYPFPFPSDSCQATREDLFTTWAKAQLGG